MISRAESIANTITMTGREYDEVCEAHRQAGYRAAMEAVNNKVFRYGGSAPAMTWKEFREWLNEQVKKEGA